MILQWANEGGGRYSTTAPDGRCYVIVPEHGHFGNNIYGYQAYRVGPGDDEQELLASNRRLTDLFQHVDSLT